MTYSVWEGRTQIGGQTEDFDVNFLGISIRSSRRCDSTEQQRQYAKIL